MLVEDNAGWHRSKKRCSAVLGRQRGLGGLPHERLPWFPPLAIASRQGETPLGIQVEFLPPYSPELQPAERLCKLVDEPLVNKCFETIDEIE
ncbi:MAG: hypothetical protein F6K50_44515 [Moorea sp. SIO3I7]|uniref:transposase n=1 Tax=Moorena sp. SIO4A5 TaxID=2607838 RepID=UPI0013C8361D|nr:transposase [Moorena sp. SIO4A5]NEO02183.1 hypothetical protein [Moorena sp. SIO3I7]NEO24995.1 hypothetical protein [Moorena sp. SIO4A5]